MYALIFVIFGDHVGDNPIVDAIFDVLTAFVPLVSDNRDGFDCQIISGLVCYLLQQSLIRTVVGHFVLSNQVAAIVNGSLDIVVAVVSVLALHDPGFWIGGQDLRFAGLFQLIKIVFVFTSAIPQFGDSLLQFGFADLLFIWLGFVKLIHLLEIAGDVFLDPNQLLDQGLLIIGIGLAVDRTDFRAVNRQQFLLIKVHRQTDADEFAKNTFHGLGVVLSKVSNGAKIRG